MLGGRKVAMPRAMALAKALQLPGRGGYRGFTVQTPPDCVTNQGQHVPLSVNPDKNLSRIRLESQSKKLLALCRQRYPARNW
eukprot:1175874-Pyramimonas_sp.AAC.1